MRVALSFRYGRILVTDRLDPEEMKTVTALYGMPEGIEVFWSEKEKQELAGREARRLASETFRKLLASPSV